MSHSAFTAQQAAVIGAGTMSRGIVMSLANAGIPVLWLDNNPQMLEQALSVVAETNAHNVKLGRISAEQSAARLACVTPVGEYAALAGADLVIEAVYENLELKQQIFRSLDRELIDGVPEEGARYAAGVVAPLNRNSDEQGCRLDTGRVSTPEGFREAYRQYVGNGWASMTGPSRRRTAATLGGVDCLMAMPEASFAF